MDIASRIYQRVGIPARFYGKFDELLERLKTSVSERPVFKHEELYYTDRRRVRTRVPGTYPYTLNPVK